MSDTPETDKEWRHPASFDGSERVVHISVAQKLERERDEIAELQLKAIREREASERESDAMLERALEAERERDEAREALEYIAHSGMTARHIADYAIEFLGRQAAK